MFGWKELKRRVFELEGRLETAEGHALDAAARARGLEGQQGGMRTRITDLGFRIHALYARVTELEGKPAESESPAPKVSLPLGIKPTDEERALFTPWGLQERTLRRAVAVKRLLESEDRAFTSDEVFDHIETLMLSTASARMTGVPTVVRGFELFASTVGLGLYRADKWSR